MVKRLLSRWFDKILPSSTFGQTALLIGGLLFVNQLVSYLSVTYYFISPSYQQINQLIANQVNTLFLYDFNRLDEVQKRALQLNSGIRFHNEVSAMHAGLSNATYYEFMSRQVSEQLGQPTEIRVRSGENYLVWIRPPQQPDMWISIPLNGVSEQSVSPLTMYFIFIGALSVIGGWLFVRRLNKPLQALQKAARQVGRGQFPEPLSLDGSSEIVAVTKAFNRMSQDIKQLESDRVIMTAGISHDLRTPLTRIRLASEMLPEDQHWVKEGIEHDIDDLNSIIDQFIDYARQDQHEEVSFVNLNDLIDELVDARRFEPDHSIELQLNEIPRVRIRRVGIKRVIENLIDNAFRYGGDRVQISTQSYQDESKVVCSIRDFGEGVKEEQLETLFTPFTQGDHARGSTGSGLGLAIVKRIVESHGGSMAFSNHPEGGLNAAFIIPVQYQNQELTNTTNVK